MAQILNCRLLSSRLAKICLVKKVPPKVTVFLPWQDVISFVSNTQSCGLNVVPSPNSYAEALTPSASECTWRQSFKEVIKLKMGSLGWAPIQQNWCPKGKRRSGHRRTQRSQPSSANQREYRKTYPPTPASLSSIP